MGLWAWRWHGGRRPDGDAQYLVPVIGALTARVLFGEDFDAHKIAGAGLILCGLAPRAGAPRCAGASRRRSPGRSAMNTVVRARASTKR